MSKGVIDILEVVEIDEESANETMISPRPQEHLLGTIKNEVAVRQSRERVVSRLVKAFRGNPC